DRDLGPAARDEVLPRALDLLRRRRGGPDGDGDRPGGAFLTHLEGDGLLRLDHGLVEDEHDVLGRLQPPPLPGRRGRLEPGPRRVRNSRLWASRGSERSPPSNPAGTVTVKGVARGKGLFGTNSTLAEPIHRHSPSTAGVMEAGGASAFCSSIDISATTGREK